MRAIAPYRRILALLVAPLVVAGLQPAGARAVPERLTFAGVLSDATGAPVDGLSYPMILRLFAVETGGEPLYAESWEAVLVEDGRLALDVGAPANGALAAAFQEHDTLFWELEVDGERLAPRQRVAAVPFALACEADPAAALDVSCPAGHALTGIDALGAASCTPVLQSLPAGIDCPEGHVLAALDPAGAPSCLPLPSAAALAAGADAYAWGDHATAGYLTEESDPRIGPLVDGGACVSDGLQVRCDAPPALTDESDPTVNALGKAPLDCAIGEHPTLLHDAAGPRWGCGAGASVSVTSFGAIPDDATDDRAAIYRTFCHALAHRVGTVVFPAGTYRVAGNSPLFPQLNRLPDCETLVGISVPADIPRPRLHILGVGDATILQTGSVARHMFFDFWAHPAGLPDIRITNLVFDGADLVATAVNVRSSSAAPGEHFIVEGSRFRNLFQVDGISTQAAAVFVGPSYDVVALRDNLVERVGRGAAGTFTSGLTITNLVGVATVENNVVRDIRTPDDLDADCVKVFGRLDDRGVRLGKGVVRDNLLENCEGRAVKFQLNDGVAENNTIRLMAGKMITNHRVVDAQVGAGRVDHNRVEIGPDVALGASVVTFEVQIEGFYAPLGSAMVRYGSIRGNRVFTAQRLPYFASLPHPEASPAVVDVSDNTVGPLDGAATGTASLATFLQYVIYEGQTDPAHLTLRVEDNVVRTNGQLLRFRADGVEFADLRDKLSLVVARNRNLFRTPPAPPELPLPRLSGNLFQYPEKVRIDDLTIAGNRDFRNMTWYGYLNGLHVGDGSAITYGTSGTSGGLENGHPTRTSWVVVERQANMLRSQYVDGQDAHQVGIRSLDTGPAFWGAWRRLD